MKTITLAAMAVAFSSSMVLAKGHMPASENGRGDGKGRAGVAFEVSKSQNGVREPGFANVASGLDKTGDVRGWGQAGGLNTGPSNARNGN